MTKHALWKHRICYMRKHQPASKESNVALIRLLSLKPWESNSIQSSDGLTGYPHSISRDDATNTSLVPWQRSMQHPVTVTHLQRVTVLAYRVAGGVKLTAYSTTAVFLLTRQTNIVVGGLKFFRDSSSVFFFSSATYELANGTQPNFAKRWRVNRANNLP